MPRRKSRALQSIPLQVEFSAVADVVGLTSLDAPVVEALPTAAQLKLLTLGREPVMVAWGGGRDSTAMIIERLARGEPIDVVLFADTGGEKPQTYAFVLLFMEWLGERGILCFIVRYCPEHTDNWPYYETLEENCITNATLPSLAFFRHNCSHKWKVGPQNKWAEAWPLAQQAWGLGCKVVKLIGYDCSPNDQRRYAELEGHSDPRFRYVYPLREWGWSLEDCIRRIQQAGLPVPPKSSCFFCPAMKPWEIDELEKPLLRRIVLLEACAMPYNKTVGGLWQKGTKGTRGGVPRPPSITQYIREKGLLPAEEIDHLAALAPGIRLPKKDVRTPIPPQWSAILTEVCKAELHIDHTPDLYTRIGLEGVRPKQTSRQIELV